MELTGTLKLLGALGEVEARMDATAALAHSFGAEALYVLVPDPDRPAKLIPARGFRTIPSVRGWRELLARCTTPGVSRGTVAYPDPASDRPACAYVFEGIVFVVVGPIEPSTEIAEPLGLTAGLLAAMLRAENELITTRGELAVERQAVERTATLAKALDRARGDAERATRVKDEFLAMLGHELRNPLAPIVTALQLLRMDGVHTRAQDILERQVAHVMRLVDDLLDVSRITSGKVELRITSVEISAAVTRAVEIARPLIEQRRNQLAIEVPAGLVVDGDPGRLEQIISNLVTNAAKYSDPGSSIIVRGERDDGIIRLSVIDHGIGIPTSLLDRVFDQFVQLPQGSDRAAGGLGLGLAIVRSLVERHGGTVRVESDGPGCGSTFIVELPAGRIHAPAISVPPVIERSSTAGRVLVVDDNTDAAEMLGDVLTAHGHTVRIAHSGPEALAGLGSFIPDAAVLDIGLPVMDGYELARLLRARLPLVKLVAVTGYGQPSDRDRSRAAGFEAHLVKPVSITNVLRTLTTLLG